MNRKKPRSFWLVVAVVIVALSAFSIGLRATSDANDVSKESRHQNETRLTSSDMERQLSLLKGALSCQRRLDVLSDVGFFDRAVGFDCIQDDEKVFFVRVYESRFSASKALQEWGATFGSGRQWIRGEQWWVIGPPPSLRDMSKIAGASMGASNAPEPVPVPMREADRDTCMSFLFSTAADRVTALPRYESEIQALNARYPGAQSSLNRTITDAVVRELADLKDYELVAALSRYGDDYRHVCSNETPE